MGTMLHSIAVANLLPARCEDVVVDSNPGSRCAKLTEPDAFNRSVWLAIIEPFLRELTECLKTLREGVRISR